MLQRHVMRFDTWWLRCPLGLVELHFSPQLRFSGSLASSCGGVKHNIQRQPTKRTPTVANSLKAAIAAGCLQCLCRGRDGRIRLASDEEKPQ